MIHISTLNEFKNGKSSSNRLNEFRLPFANLAEAIKTDINDTLRKEYPNCEIHAYYITKNPNEDRMAVVIRSIDFMPYSNEYQQAVIKNDKTVKFTDDKKYNDDFKELMADISNLIVLNDLEVFDITLSPICKSEIEVKIYKNNHN